MADKALGVSAQGKWPKSAGVAQTGVLRRGMTPTGGALGKKPKGTVLSTGPPSSRPLVYDPRALTEPGDDRSAPTSGLNFRLVRRLKTIGPPAADPSAATAATDAAVYLTVDGGATFIPQSPPHGTVAPPPARVRRYNELVGAALFAVAAAEVDPFASQTSSSSSSSSSSSAPPRGRRHQAGATLLEAWDARPPAQFGGYQAEKTIKSLEAAWKKRPEFPTPSEQRASDQATVAAVLADARPAVPIELHAAASEVNYEEYRFAEMLALERDAAETARLRRRGELFTAQFMPQPARGKRPARPGIPPVSPLEFYAFAATRLTR